jgi:hypothetical protein
LLGGAAGSFLFERAVFGHDKFAILRDMMAFLIQKTGHGSA